MLMNYTNLMLSALTNAQKANWGLKGLIIGLGSVFVILIVLIFVINLLKLTSKDKSKAKTAKSVTEAKPVASKNADEDEDEIIAVIAAAISCMAHREGKRYAIRSFKRVGSRTRRSY